MGCLLRTADICNANSIGLPSPINSVAPSENGDMPANGTTSDAGDLASLKDSLMHHLIVTLPHMLSAFSHPGAPGQSALASVYARLPFDVLKLIIESSKLAPSDMERVSLLSCLQHVEMRSLIQTLISSLCKQMYC